MSLRVQSIVDEFSILLKPYTYVHVCDKEGLSTR